MSINALFERLKATSSSNAKLEILKGLDDQTSKLFKDVAVAALDQDIRYFITDVTLKGKNFLSQDSLEVAMEKLKVLSSRQLTGNAARSFLDETISRLSEDDALVIRRIINKDLDCGVSSTTVNKVWPDLIYQHPYMRCSSFNKKNLAKLSLPCYSQTKEDGLYIDIVVGSDEVNYMTRSGQIVNQYGNSDKNSTLIQYASGHVLMGEALVLNSDGTYMNRQEGNGYLNSDDVDASRVVFVCWDMVPITDWRSKESNTVYVDRLTQLTAVVQAMALDASYVRLVDTKICHSIEDIIEHFKENVALGKEGTVAKNFKTKWADGTSSDQVKLKIEFECDLEVVSVEEGTGKHSGKLGSVLCKSSEGIVKVNVGGGYNDRQRSEFFGTNLDGSSIIEGAIFTVKANDLIVTDSGTSLFLPRFVEWRKDKTEADTFDRILEQKNAFVDVLRSIKGV